MALSGIARLNLQMEGEIQAREEGTVGQGVLLRIAFGAGLLKGDIWHSQRRAFGHEAACVSTGRGSRNNIFQNNFLLV